MLKETCNKCGNEVIEDRKLDSKVWNCPNCGLEEYSSVADKDSGGEDKYLKIEGGNYGMEKGNEKKMILDESILICKKPGFTLKDFQIKSGYVYCGDERIIEEKFLKSGKAIKHRYNDNAQITLGDIVKYTSGNWDYLGIITELDNDSFGFVYIDNIFKRIVKTIPDLLNDIEFVDNILNMQTYPYLDVSREQTALLLKEYYISVSVKKMMEDRLTAFTRRRDGLRLFLFDMEELSRELRDLKDHTATIKEAKAQYAPEKNTDIYYKIIAEVTDSLLMTTNCRTESQFPELEKIIKSCTGTLTSRNTLYINGNALLPKEQQHKNLSYIGLAKILREECKRLYGYDVQMMW